MMALAHEMGHLPPGFPDQGRVLQGPCQAEPAVGQHK